VGHALASQSCAVASAAAACRSASATSAADSRMCATDSRCRTRAALLAAAAALHHAGGLGFRLWGFRDLEIEVSLIKWCLIQRLFGSLNEPCHRLPERLLVSAAAVEAIGTGAAYSGVECIAWR